MGSTTAERLPLPADLAITAALALAATLAMTVPGLRETPLRLAFGIPYLAVAPGYALVSALFPEADGRTDDGSADGPGGIDAFERLALSFGLSVLVVPLLGLLLNFTPLGIRLRPVVGAVTGLTLLLVGVAAWRRAALDPADRFGVLPGAWLPDVRGGLRPGIALDAFLVAAVLIATAGAGYVVAAPGQGEQFTELYVVTETDSGEFVADGYPTNFTAGESKSLHVAVANHERRPVRYTLVTQLQQVERDGGTLAVRNRTELDRSARIVQPNRTWRSRKAVAPTMTGDRLRLTYLLYRGSVPETPTVDNAYQEVHLWINVTAS